MGDFGTFLQYRVKTYGRHSRIPPRRNLQQETGLRPAAGRAGSSGRRARTHRAADGENMEMQCLRLQTDRQRRCVRRAQSGNKLTPDKQIIRSESRRTHRPCLSACRSEHCIPYFAPSAARCVRARLPELQCARRCRPEAGFRPQHFAHPSIFRGKVVYCP